MLKSEKKVNQGKKESDDSSEVVFTVVDQPMYTAQVVSVHDGYSYMANVQRSYETINTNGDVFVPKVFVIDDLVQFQDLNDDPKRPGKFRTEKANVIKNALAEISSEASAMTIYEATTHSPYHTSAKKIGQEEIEKAAENNPFAEMLGIHNRVTAAGLSQNNLDDAIQHFLEGQYANLSSIGVDYRIDGSVDIEEEREKVKEACKIYKKSGMEGQIETLQKEYASFVGIREAFRIMKENDILSIESIIPIKYLPDLLVASPVWYVDSRHGLKDESEENDPKVDHAIKYFCNTVGSTEFAWFYQMYNRRTRPIKTFSGRDIMPLPIVKILEKARATFDYVVIATPYHDIASKEWSDPEWMRNIDPFLFGFVKGLPYMFMLGRWSGTGLFPLMCDMVADTMNHVKINKSLLENFPANSYWYKGGDTLSNGITCLQNISNKAEDNDVLEPFANKCIKSYEEGGLFDFLRGEKKQLEGK